MASIIRRGTPYGVQDIVSTTGNSGSMRPLASTKKIRAATLVNSKEQPFCVVLNYSAILEQK